MKTIRFATFAVVACSVVLGLAGPANASSDTMYGDPIAAAKSGSPSSTTTASSWPAPTSSVR